MTKQASGLFSAIKKGWHMIRRHFSKHKGAIATAAKKHAIAVAGESGKRIRDSLVGVARRNVDHYTRKAERKIDSLATRAENHIRRYDKPRR
jgi:hypothetical protein